MIGYILTVLGVLLLGFYVVAALFYVNRLPDQ